MGGAKRIIALEKLVRTRKPRAKTYSTTKLITILTGLKEAIATKEYTRDEIVEGLEQIVDMLKEKTS